MNTEPTRYTRPTVRRELQAADGSMLNYSIGAHRTVADYADRYPGCRVVETMEHVEVNASEKVLIDSGISEEHWPLLRADARRMSNMTADAGRPSDAMRSSVRAFKNGTLTQETFDAARPSGSGPGTTLAGFTLMR